MSGFVECGVRTSLRQGAVMSTNLLKTKWSRSSERFSTGRDSWKSSKLRSMLRLRNAADGATLMDRAYYEALKAA